ncbi:MAG: ShlB/FhaC/HecB family hemolysin secretion/activation protein, partial [Verrucomicrobiota bacterium]
MASLEVGNAFRYDEMRSTMRKLNALDDLTIHSEMKVREEPVEGTGYGRRHLDLDLFVEEDFLIPNVPLKGSIGLRNIGTKATEELRLGVKLEVPNLTKRFDPLTVTFPVSIDFSTIRSFTANYVYPFKSEKGGVTLFGGYSELDTPNVFPDVDVKGTGWFFGPRWFHRVSGEDDDYLKNVSIGLLYRHVDDEAIFSPGGGEPATTDRTELQVLPLSLSFNLGRRELDRWGGRMFLTGILSYNLGDVLGVTREKDLKQQQEFGDPDYITVLLSGARIQTLDPSWRSRDEDNRDDDDYWLLFSSFDVQYTPDSLIAAERKTLGGQATVRGYDERVVSGDFGLSARLELRTPILPGLRTMRFRSEATFEEKKLPPRDFFQLVFFTEGGFVGNHEDVEGVPTDHEMLSLGA